MKAKKEKRKKEQLTSQRAGVFQTKITGEIIAIFAKSRRFIGEGECRLSPDHFIQNAK